MIKTLKFSSKGLQKLWFLSDSHLNHKLADLLEERGFKTPEENTEAVIKSVNDNVGTNDILFNLGDLFLNTTEEVANQCLDRINCQYMYSLMGNHPNPLRKMYFKALLESGYKEGIEVYPFRYKNLIFVGDSLQIYVDNQGIFMSHFPQMVFEGMKLGNWAFCGNEHGKVKELLPDYPVGKRLDLSWEVFRRPMEYNELKVIMDKKQIFNVGHH